MFKVEVSIHQASAERGTSMTTEHMVAISDAVTCIGISLYIIWQARLHRVDPIERWVPLGLTAVYLFLTYLLWHACAADGAKAMVFPHPVVYWGIVPGILSLLAAYPLYQYGQWLWRGRFVEADMHCAKEQQRCELQAARMQILFEQTRCRLQQMRRLYNDGDAANSDALAAQTPPKSKKATP